MDKNLLIEIFRIPAPSGEENDMANFIMKFLLDNSISFKKDKKGNIFSLKNTNSPLLSSHMDTVQDSCDVLLTNFIEIRGNTLSGYGVIGADDKCGIYIILDLLRQKKDLNFIFSVEEEIGGKGISNFIKEKDFSNVLYGLVLDRRGSGDIICFNNNYGSYKFEKELLLFGKEFKYSKEIGIFSDADFLNKKISCANLSVGYYNPHSKTEFVRINELQNATDFVLHIVENLKEKFEKPKYIEKYTYYSEYYNTTKETDNINTLPNTYYICDSCEKFYDLVYFPSFNKYFCKKCIMKFVKDLKWQGELTATLKKVNEESMDYLVEDLDMINEENYFETANNMEEL